MKETKVRYFAQELGTRPQVTESTLTFSTLPQELGSGNIHYTVHVGCKSKKMYIYTYSICTIVHQAFVLLKALVGFKCWYTLVGLQI